jgi:hypothetical protein
MKKATTLLCCLMSITGMAGAQTDDGRYVLDFIDMRFTGFYIPLNFVYALERTRHYTTARDFARGDYEYIIVFEDSIRYQRPAEDCYFEVSVEEARDYQFYYMQDQDLFIANEKGNRYKRMTGHTDYQTAYRVINQYMASVVLADFLKGGEIILEESTLIIPALDNRKFDIVTWRQYGFEEDANLFLYSNNEWAYLELQGRECAIYRTTGWRSQKPGRAAMWKTQLKANGKQ